MQTSVKSLIDFRMQKITEKKTNKQKLAQNIKLITIITKQAYRIC